MRQEHSLPWDCVAGSDAVGHGPRAGLTVAAHPRTTQVRLCGTGPRGVGTVAVRCAPAVLRFGRGIGGAPAAPAGGRSALER